MKKLWVSLLAMLLTCALLLGAWAEVVMEDVGVSEEELFTEPVEEEVTEVEEFALGEDSDDIIDNPYSDSVDGKTVSDSSDSEFAVAALPKDGTASNIQISASFDKQSYNVGDPVKVTWKITGAKTPYQSLSAELYASYTDGSIKSLASTSSASATSLTCNKAEGDRMWLSFSVRDADGKFNSYYSDDVAVKGDTSSPITITVSFDKSTYNADDPVKVTWKITGAKIPYQSLSAELYASYADGSIESLASTSSVSATSLTCDKAKGNKMWLSFSVRDADGKFNSYYSDDVAVKGDTSSPITITVSFDKSTYNADDPVKVTWKITGAKIPYQSLSAELYASYADGSIESLASTSSVSATSLTCDKAKGNKMWLSFSVRDADGKFSSYYSDDAIVNPQKEHTHTPVTVKGYTATYVKDGLTDGTKCSVCGTTIRAQTTIPRKVYPGSNLGKTGKNGTITVNLGEQFTLTPEFAASAGLTVKGYKSSKKKVAAVDGSGIVTAKAEGKATITVTTNNKKKKATVVVKVVDPYKPTGVSITNGKKVTLEMGKTLKLGTQLKPSTAQSNLTWKSGKKKVATVDGNGLVTPHKEGTAKITVTTRNKKKATITVKVVDPYKPTGISITNGRTVTLKVGETLKLGAQLKPTTAQSELTWKSANKKIATVDATGTVKALKKGKVKITVTTKKNKKKTTITVKVVP